MEIYSQLSHVDSDKIIVKLTALNQGKLLGSALGQGANVIDAELAAMKLLSKRVKLELPDSKNANYSNESENSLETINSDKNIVSNEFSNTNLIQVNQNHSTETLIPSDWSKEISKIEYEINRIGWTKEEEKNFINKILGYTSRNRIKDYIDILLLIEILNNIQKGNKDVVLEKIFIKDNLIEKSDEILKRLNWNTSTAREYLLKNFNEQTRSNLSIKDLLKFNIILERQLESQDNL